MPPIFSTFIRYGSRSSSTTTQLPTEFLAFFSLISSPCGARPGTGLAEPAERPRRERKRLERAWSGAEGDCAAGTRSCGGRPLAGCRSVEQDGAWSRAVGLPVGGARARRSALACGTRAPTLAARCGAQTFGLRGGASDLGASRLLMQQQSAAAWAGTSSASSDAVIGMTVERCYRARAYAKAAGAA